MLGLGLGLTNFGTRGGVSDVPDALSGASSLLRGEDGLAIDFSDQSIAIRDTTTPANNIASAGTVRNGALVGPGAKITYTSPSPKLTLQSTGYYAYQAHNRYLYSETPSNAAWAKSGACTVVGNLFNTNSATNYQYTSNATGLSIVAGRKYTYTVRVKNINAAFIHISHWHDANASYYAAIILKTSDNSITTATGSAGFSVNDYSVTNLGSGVLEVSMTVTSGQTSALARFGIGVSADGTITGFGLKNFAATNIQMNIYRAHLYDYPANTDYISTTSAAVYALPYEWDTSGVLQGIMVEEARTNLALWNSDFTNAAWTKSNMTTAKTATGPDGVSNSATTLTATAGNATALQAITSASSARITSCYIKRRTGTGNIDLTQDNGSTWATVTVTSSWTRVEIASVTSTNPTVGIRIVTSGDAVDVALFQHEVGSFITSPIQTFAATVTRAADALSVPLSAFPSIASAVTMYAVYSQPHGHVTAAVLSHRGGDNNNRVEIETGSSTTSRPRGAITTAGVSQMSQEIAAAAYAPGTFTAVALAATTNDANVARDGTVGTTDTSVTMPSTTQFIIGSRGGGVIVLNGHFKEIMVLPRIMTNAELQVLTA